MAAGCVRLRKQASLMVQRSMEELAKFTNKHFVTASSEGVKNLIPEKLWPGAAHLV